MSTVVADVDLNEPVNAGCKPVSAVVGSVYVQVCSVQHRVAAELNQGLQSSFLPPGVYVMFGSEHSAGCHHVSLDPGCTLLHVHRQCRHDNGLLSRWFEPSQPHGDYIRAENKLQSISWLFIPPVIKLCT